MFSAGCVVYCGVWISHQGQLTLMLVYSHNHIRICVQIVVLSCLFVSSYLLLAVQTKKKCADEQ